MCVCVSNLNRLTLGWLELKEVFSGFAASWGVSRHSARGGGFRTNACWAEHWAPVCLPTTFAKENTGRRNYAATQISHADSKDWPVCWSGRALKNTTIIGKLVTVSFKLCMISSHWYVSSCAGADHVLGHCACRLCRRSCHYFALRISCPSLAYGGCACGLRLRFFAVHMHLSSRLSLCDKKLFAPATLELKETFVSAWHFEVVSEICTFQLSSVASGSKIIHESFLHTVSRHSLWTLNILFLGCLPLALNFGDTLERIYRN